MQVKLLRYSDIFAIVPGNNTSDHYDFEVAVGLEMFERWEATSLAYARMQEEMRAAINDPTRCVLAPIPFRPSA